MDLENSPTFHPDNSHTASQHDGHSVDHLSVPSRNVSQETESEDSLPTTDDIDEEDDFKDEETLSNNRTQRSTSAISPNNSNQVNTKKKRKKRVYPDQQQSGFHFNNIRKSVSFGRRRSRGSHNGSNIFPIFTDSSDDFDDDDEAVPVTEYTHDGLDDSHVLCGERIHKGRKNKDYKVFGTRRYLKSELRRAHGGTLVPGLAPPTVHKFGNPVPLGLSAFAFTTFCLSFYNARVKHVNIPNMVVGPAIFYGGFVQIIAGVWELALENTFGATALCSYGGFWMSFGSIFIPWFGIQDAFKDHPREFDNALAIYLLGWCIFTFGLAVCTMKSTVAFFALFFLLGITFLLLSLGNFCNSPGVTRAGGILGVIVAFIAWYNAFAGLTDKNNSYFVIRSMELPTNEKHLGWEPFAGDKYE